MTELFQMPRGMLKDLLLLHYYELRSAEEEKKAEYLTALDYASKNFFTLREKHGKKYPVFFIQELHFICT